MRDRIDWVLAERGWSRNAWCERAKVDRGALRQAERRAGEDISLTVSVLVKLADAAGVSIEWLAAGTGEPFRRPAMEPDLKYPSRPAAIAAARLWLYEPDVIAKVQAIADLPTDPGREYWTSLLEAEQALARSRQRRSE